MWKPLFVGILSPIIIGCFVSIGIDSLSGNSQAANLIGIATAVFSLCTILPLWVLAHNIGFPNGK